MRRCDRIDATSVCDAHIVHGWQGQDVPTWAIAIAAVIVLGFVGYAFYTLTKTLVREGSMESMLARGEWRRSGGDSLMPTTDSIAAVQSEEKADKAKQVPESTVGHPELRLSLCK